MSLEISKEANYGQEVERKIDELITWAVACAPHQASKLSIDDFAEVRRQFCTIAKGGGSPLEQEPEPSEGGAQYINDNPAPWP